MRNIALLLEYDGTNYCGWQVQDNGSSVQAVVQEAVRQLTKESNRVVGASRTDAGVHALGQVANFHTRSDIPAEAFIRGLIPHLPADVVVRDAAEVATEFNARHDARSKRYCYIIHESPTRSALLRHKTWHRRGQLNVNAMAAAAEALIGQHDFTTFCATNDRNPSKVRRLTKLSVRRMSWSKVWPLPHPGRDKVIVFEVEGEAFLQQMVRNIVGTLVEVGEGRRPATAVAKILRAKDRRLAGPCAPGAGLSLAEVVYAAPLFNGSP